MIAISLALLMAAPQAEERTPSIYRFPAKVEHFRFVERLVSDYYFDTYCVEPKPTDAILNVIKGTKIKLIDPKDIDTEANLKWRDATIRYAKGDISPKQWLNETRRLNETVHFLSSPVKTKGLREEMGTDPLAGSYSARSVFAEFILLTWPGRPCLTEKDVWRTSYLPGPGRLESWILAMNDYLGPLMYMRMSEPHMVTTRPTILRADDKPGLFIFQYKKGNKSHTFFFNNAKHSVELPWFNGEIVGIARGLDVDDKPKLMPTGVMIEIRGDESSPSSR